jgi:hypothetical protein
MVRLILGDLEVLGADADTLTAQAFELVRRTALVFYRKTRQGLAKAFSRRPVMPGLLSYPETLYQG